MLEIACFNISSATAAANAGADRIELCDNPSDGGTTPSYGIIKLALEKITIPIFPIIRPRGGDFIYNKDEYNAMLYDVQLCSQLNCQGIVTGLLKKDGSVDIERTKLLVQAAGNMQVTFHRAFDYTVNPFKALEDIITTGCTRLLTSGQMAYAFDGKQLIKQLIEQAANRIIIMPGGGIRSFNIDEIASFTRATEFHSGARVRLQSIAEYKSNTLIEDSINVGVDSTEIKNMKKILNTNP